MNKYIFHLAFPITNLEECKRFYLDGLGCKLGREATHSLILDFFQAQIVGHLVDALEEQKGIYPRHFGIVFTDKADWEALLGRAKANKLNFFQDAKLRFSGEKVEHHTFFLRDPSGNLLEFKFYSEAEAIFGSQDIHKIGDSI